MLNVNKRRRFPRGKFARHFDALANELEQWHRLYDQEISVCDSPVMRALLDERREAIDQVHDLARQAERTLAWLRPVTKRLDRVTAPSDRNLVDHLVAATANAADVDAESPVFPHRR